MDTFLLSYGLFKTTSLPYKCRNKICIHQILPRPTYEVCSCLVISVSASDFGSNGYSKLMKL